MYFTAKHITYNIPKLSPEEEKLWRIFYLSKSNRFLHISNIKDSALVRLVHRRPVPKRHKQLFARIANIEGKGSKMAIKIISHIPSNPISITGIDAETGQLFDARYAETEMQRLSISREYEVLKKLSHTGIVPEILEHKQSIDSTFLKVTIPEGESLYEHEMNEDMINYLVSLTQFSMNQFREENSLGLITCLSNGSFSSWNTLRDADGDYHMLHWHNAADRPLGYDLLYYLIKPYLDNGDESLEQKMQEQSKWVEMFYSMFGVEEYQQYIEVCANIYAAQLESDGRYVEANKVRIIKRRVVAHYEKRHQKADTEQQSRPRVLFIMHMPPPVHGASMVGKWIHESEYINSKFDCYYLNLTAAASMADIGKVSFAKITRFFLFIRTIRSLVKRIDPTLIYMTPNASGMPFIKDSIVVNMLKGMGCHVLAHFHNKGVSQYEKNPVFNRMYRKFFDRLKVLLIVPSLYDDNKTYLRIRDLYICPNGTPLTLEEEIPSERHNEVPEILFLSNMIISKGVLDLLDALYLLRGQDYEFHCTFIGAETPELTREKMQYEIESRHLTDYVDYIGPRYGSDKEDYLRRADIMAFPTYYPKECFPLVILEAMEYKLPVVSTNEAGIPYSVIDGETGLLCKSQNPISLSEKLAKLLDNPQMRWKMGEEGFKLRKEKFCLDTFEHNLSVVLERAIKDTNDAR